MQYNLLIRHSKKSIGTDIVIDRVQKPSFNDFLSISYVSAFISGVFTTSQEITPVPSYGIHFVHRRYLQDGL